MMASIIRPQGACTARALVAGWLLLMSITGCAHLGQSPSQPSAPVPASRPPETDEPKSSAPRDETAAGAASKSEAENSSAAAKARSDHGATTAGAKPPSAAKGNATKANSGTGNPTTGNSATGNPAAGKGLSRTAAPPTLALSEIEQRLRDTHAIGVFTKLSLKNQIDDLLGQLRAYHLKQTDASLPQLRQRYDVLLQKVIDLLQSGDASLARDISSSREAIWTMLTDPTTISKL